MVVQSKETCFYSLQVLLLSFTLDPGLTKINPVTEKLIRVDIKIQIADIPQQVIMTKDNVNVQIDSVLYWHIINPSQSVFGVSDVKAALIER